MEKPELISIGALASRVGLSIQWVRHLADSGEIPFTLTTGGHRRFDPEAVRRALDARNARIHGGSASNSSSPVIESLVPGRSADWDRTLRLAGLEEHQVWRDVHRGLQIDTEIASGAIVRYAFTEMLNNAIDHSRGTSARIQVWIDPERLVAVISDDGVGIFANVRSALGLGSDLEAIAELSKGKVTTASTHHSGEGIFFTSKAVDFYQLTAGGLRWSVDNLRRDQAVGEATLAPGTTVAFTIARLTSRVLRDVFERFTEDFAFSRSQPVVKLFGLGMPFVARSEARRLLEGMDRFSEVLVDFAGVIDVGQGFVDELIRVWPSQHPGVKIVPINMNPAVEFMVRRGLARHVDDASGRRDN